MSEIDPELDATWRAASREQPPPALDDAIRAAARREVGAKPGGFRAAPRWVPLAAAATVAAIAVGIVQMTPPEEVTTTPGRVTPAPITAATDPVADAAKRDAKPDSGKANAARSNADKPQREAQVVAAAPEAPREVAKPRAKEMPEIRRGAADENDRGVLARNRSEGFAAAPRDQLQEKKRLDSRQAPLRMEESAERELDLKQKTELAAATSAAAPKPAASPPPVSSVARNELQAFPAAPAPAPAKSSVANAPPHVAAAEPASAPAGAGAPAVEAHSKLAAQSSATGAVPGSLAGHIAGGARNAETAPAQDAAALEKKAAVMADKVTAERSKDIVPLAPDEWIKRIRRLIAEGKSEDAARELTAFRREYRERSEALLPSDLRAFRR